MNQTALIIGTHDNDQTNRKQADLFDAVYTVVIFPRVYVWNDCLVFFTFTLVNQGFVAKEALQIMACIDNMTGRIPWWRHTPLSHHRGSTVIWKRKSCNIAGRYTLLPLSNWKCILCIIYLQSIWVICQNIKYSVPLAMIERRFVLHLEP